MVGQDEGLPAAVELAFDRAQDFGEERVHDVVHDDADDARARGAQAGGAAVVDIADGAGMFLDAVARAVGDQRAVAQGQRNRGRGDAERIRDRRKLDLLCQRALQPPPTRSFKLFKCGLCHRIAARIKAFSPVASSSVFGAARIAQPQPVFAVDDVEAAGDDDRGAGQRPAIGKLLEDQLAETDHPDHLHIGIGRQRRRRRHAGRPGSAASGRTPPKKPSRAG